MKKQDLLLALVDKLEKRGLRSKTAIEKCLFLLKEEYGLDKHMSFYSFFPYKYGPFSNVSYADLDSLEQAGFIDENWTHVTEKGLERLGEIDTQFDRTLDELLSRFKDEKTVVEYVYANYGRYTVRSERTKRVEKGEPGFYTIGYERRDIDSFLDVLIQNKIDLLIDVRQNPFSMKFSFTKKKLGGYLEKVEIGYTHVPELGVASEDRKGLYSREEYERLFSNYRESLPEKKEYLEEILNEGSNKRVALMCFERDPLSCHRREVAGYIRGQGHQVIDL